MITSKSGKIIFVVSVLVITLSIFFGLFYGIKPTVTLDYGYEVGGWYLPASGKTIGAVQKIEYVSVVRGTKFIPKTPTRSGYKFVDWYLDAEFTKPLYDTRIYKDTTLYAKWEKL